ncbi:unnamed protein product, partial [Arabidopsis halleri]
LVCKLFVIKVSTLHNFSLAISASFFARSRLSSVSSPTNTSLTALSTFFLLMKSHVVLRCFFRSHPLIIIHHFPFHPFFKPLW